MCFTEDIAEINKRAYVSTDVDVRSSYLTKKNVRPLEPRLGLYTTNVRVIETNITMLNKLRFQQLIIKQIASVPEISIRAKSVYFVEAHHHEFAISVVRYVSRNEAVQVAQSTFNVVAEISAPLAS